MSNKHKSLFGISAVVLLLASVAGYFAFCPLAQDERDTAKQFFGYTPQPTETAKFVASLPTPTISDADPNIFRGDKIDTFLYRALYAQHKKVYGTEWVVGAQGIGDCVSWGWAHAVDISLAIDCEIGKSDGFKLAATESIYGGSRVEARGVSFGGWGDGSYGGAAAKWVKDWGVVYREKVGEHDLTKYSSNRAKNFGAYGNGGKDDAGKLDEIAKHHAVRDVTLVRNFDEAAAAIQNGYPVPVCSGVGFDPMSGNVRDADGFAKPRGGWAHCMCFVGVRYGNRPGLLVLNSWGTKWISGPKFPDDQPDGSFWVDADVATRMLKGGDSFAVSGVEGFKQRKINHSAWAQLKPAKRLDSEPQYALAP